MTNEERKKFDQKRLDDNTKLWVLLKDLIAKNPSLRFGQILVNYGFVVREEVTINYGNGREAMEYIWFDEIHTEPGTVLKRVQDAIQRQTSSTEG